MASYDEKKLVIDGNLFSLENEISDCLERRAAHIEEKAQLLTDIGENATDEELADIYRDIAVPLNGQDSCIEENKPYVSAVMNAINVIDRAKYAQTISRKSGKSFFVSENETALGNEIVYLKNSLADSAFSIFSKIITDVRARYSDSFSGACEEVYYGRAAYCVLPTENTDDGRLSGFVNLIRKYELKTVLTCNVANVSGNMTKFALLKRELEIIDCPTDLNGGHFVEICFIPDGNEKLSSVLTTAQLFGFSLNKIDSLPTSYSDSEYRYNAVFTGDGDINGFACWLSLEVPGFEISGIYTQVNLSNGG